MAEDTPESRSSRAGPDRSGACPRVRHRYVFVAGLHRTGTSLLARIIGSHPEIATIEGAQVPENEGCYLQGAIPHTARHGVPGEYALDPEQHFTEDSRFNTLETRLRLEHDWGEWFDPGKPWRLEKSPVNLARMRLLQALFPMAHFIVVTRHPLVMAHALQKWSGKSVDELAAYGVAAYRRMLEDAAYCHAVMIVRYEDMVASPGAYCRAFESFLALGPGIDPPDMRDGNRDYDPAECEDGALPELGYGPGGHIDDFAMHVRHPLRDRQEATVKHM